MDAQNLIDIVNNVLARHEEKIRSDIAFNAAHDSMLNAIFNLYNNVGDS